jgi:hypothetical protein
MLRDLLSSEETAELARRWVAALLMVPAEERAVVVEAVEDRIVETYGTPAGDAPAERLVHVREPPAQREGYVEEVIRTYGVAEGGGGSAGSRARRRRRSG